jgi:hypothetical protein
VADEITAVWGILKDMTVLFENSISRDLTGAAALPEAGGRQISASELAWPDGGEHHIQVSTDHWFMGEVTLHVRWKSGGTFNTRGLFVQNAEMSVSGEVTHGATVRVTGHWTEASHNGAPANPMAYLRGNINVEMATSVPFTTRHLDNFEVFCRGDGGGEITQQT